MCRSAGLAEVRPARPAYPWTSGPCAMVVHPAAGGTPSAHPTADPCCPGHHPPNSACSRSASVMAGFEPCTLDSLRQARAGRAECVDVEKGGQPGAPRRAAIGVGRAWLLLDRLRPAEWRDGRVERERASYTRARTTRPCAPAHPRTRTHLLRGCCCLTEVRVLEGECASSGAMLCMCARACQCLMPHKRGHARPCFERGGVPGTRGFRGWMEGQPTRA